MAMTICMARRRRAAAGQILNSKTHKERTEVPKFRPQDLQLRYTGFVVRAASNAVENSESKVEDTGVE